VRSAGCCAQMRRFSDEQDTLNRNLALSGDAGGQRVAGRAKPIEGAEKFVHPRPRAGEAAFIAAATQEARARVRDGLPLRAQINVAGYLARKPRLS
jgi:hypothetical protein